ncbi:RNA polymerase sigma factor [Brucella pseudogrignonensis]|uniref:RNA polymerase sigma factor n=1 Tax=Brucella pseudogrignonensis TaxID=419475 RepID=UPI003D953AC6
MDAKSDEIDTLYRAERKRLERMVIRKIGAPNASDVVQDVFVRLWGKTREHIILTPAYLSRCVRNAAIDLIRVENRHKKLPEMLKEEQYTAPVATPEQIVIAINDVHQIDKAIRSLPERVRHIFLLNRIHGCSYDEIAEVLNISYSTVERDMAKAILACRQAAE